MNRFKFGVFDESFHIVDSVKLDELVIGFLGTNIELKRVVTPEMTNTLVSHFIENFLLRLSDVTNYILHVIP